MSEEASKSSTAPKTNGDSPSSQVAEGALRNFAELEQHFERIKKLHAQTAQREAELERLSADVLRRSKELDNRSSELDAWAKQVDDERVGVEGMRREIDAARQDLEKKRTELDAAQKKLDDGAAALERGNKEAAELGARLESTRNELEGRARAIETREKTVGEREQQLAEMQKGLDEARALLEREKSAAKELQQRLDGEQRDLAATQQRLATMMKAVQARATELDEREKNVAAREKSAPQLKEQDKAAAEKLKQLEASVAQRAAELAGRDAEIARLKTEAEKLAGEVAQAKAASAAGAKPSPADAKARVELEAELEKSRHAIELLAEKLRAAQKESETLRKKAAEQPARQPAVSADGRRRTDPHNLLRRKRLQKYKALLQSQARKIMSAQAALAKRQAEADQILAHRGKLAAAAEHIRVRETKLNAQRAKSAGALLAMSFAVTTAAMGAMAWFASLHVAPAVYVATAAISADARGRTESHSDLEGWQRYHDELVLDPQLIGQAAERVGRRGISDLSNASVFAAHLRDNLIVESPKHGELVLQLKGRDAQQTAILLDTYVTALTATSNMTRTQRPDGLVSEITRPVEVPGAPVADERLTYAGAIFGGGMFASFLLGGIGWQRVARSRRRPDGDEAVENFLDDKNWPKPQA